MPVVGRRNHHDIDIRTGQKTAKVVISAVRPQRSFLSGTFAVPSVHITDCDHLNIGLGHKCPQVPMSSSTGADKTHRDAIVRCDTAGLGQSRWANNKGKDCCPSSNAGCLSQEIPPSCVFRSGHIETVFGYVFARLYRVLPLASSTISYLVSQFTGYDSRFTRCLCNAQPSYPDA